MVQPIVSPSTSRADETFTDMSACKQNYFRFLNASFRSITSGRIVACYSRAQLSRRDWLAVTGALLVSSPANAANDAILQKLDGLKTQQYRFELDAPSEARKERILAAQQQIAKVTRLVQLEQYDSARRQLREGVVSTLRKDLRDAQESYKRVTPPMVDNVKNELERLDQALRFEDADEIWNHLAATDVALKDILTVIQTTNPF